MVFRRITANELAHRWRPLRDSRIADRRSVPSSEPTGFGFRPALAENASLIARYELDHLLDREMNPPLNNASNASGSVELSLRSRYLDPVPSNTISSCSPRQSPRCSNVTIVWTHRYGSIGGGSRLRKTAFQADSHLLIALRPFIPGSANARDQVPRQSAWQIEAVPEHPPEQSLQGPSINGDVQVGSVAKVALPDY